MQVQLDGVLGIGSNKLVAQTAADLMQPAQLYEVRHGSECAFMAPFCRLKLCCFSIVRR